MSVDHENYSLVKENSFNKIHEECFAVNYM